MDPITQQATIAAAGAGGGGPLYVDDVFSTYLYTGNNATQTITNGIDLAGEGGLVWIKNRSTSAHNVLVDTERGVDEYLKSDEPDSQGGAGTRFDAFNSNGFDVGASSVTNGSGNDIASWTFRKAPGFFDVVTFTGNGTSQSIAHSLGSVPGCIIFKNIDTGNFWAVYHRGISVPANKALSLSETWAEDDDVYFNDTAPTSTHFTVGAMAATNGSGNTIVAYIFAHDDAQFGTDEDESIIKCGSYTGNSSSPRNLDIGFEPQFFLVKNSSRAGNEWFMFDTMRGMYTTNNLARYFKANTSDAEAGTQIGVYSSGVIINETNTPFNYSGDTYVYIAIRRPNKPPTAATEVFKATNLVGGTVSLGFVPDLNISKYTAGSQSWFWLDRLRGGSANLFSDSTAAEAGGVGINFDETTNSISGGGYGTLYANWAFKRAPGFFDVVAYTGDGTASHAVPHNLEAVPELMLIKRRDTTSNWVVYAEGIGASPAASYFLYLRSNDARGSSGNFFDDTAPTSSVFRIGGSNNVNNSSGKYIAYLFATLPGISKVGSYTGNSGTQAIDCGFTNGARFVLIKRTDAAGHWYLWDTARGITTGNDNYFEVNNADAQYTENANDLEPDSAGFKVRHGGATDVNIDTATYIFLAIA